MVWIFSVLSALEENKSLIFLSQKKDENTELSKCLTWQLGGSLGHLHWVSKSPASDFSFLPMCAAESSRDSWVHPCGSTGCWQSFREWTSRWELSSL